MLLLKGLRVSLGLEFKEAKLFWHPHYFIWDKTETSCSGRPKEMGIMIFSFSIIPFNLVSNPAKPSNESACVHCPEPR